MPLQQSAAWGRKSQLGERALLAPNQLAPRSHHSRTAGQSSKSRSCSDTPLPRAARQIYACALTGLPRSSPPPFSFPAPSLPPSSTRPLPLPHLSPPRGTSVRGTVVRAPGPCTEEAETRGAPRAPSGPFQGLPHPVHAPHPPPRLLPIVHFCSRRRPGDGALSFAQGGG